MSPEGPKPAQQNMITGVPGMEPVQSNPDAVQFGSNVPLEADGPAAMAFQAGVQRALDTGSAGAPELSAVGTPDKTETPRFVYTQDQLIQMPDHMRDSMLDAQAKGADLIEGMPIGQPAAAEAAASPKLIDSVPWDTTEFDAKRAADKAAKDAADAQMPYHGGYTGTRISELKKQGDIIARHQFEAERAAAAEQAANAEPTSSEEQ